ncbi:MAG: class I SAM-dependent methyltransferase, partial [Paludibacteraceae bacterium]
MEIEMDASGSYIYDNFGCQETELEILKRQASLALQLEKTIWEEAGLSPDMDILDMGCGCGLTSVHLAEYAQTGSVWGVDPSKALIREAEKLKREKLLPNLKFSIGDVYGLSLPDKKFDFVYCRLLFQHLSDPARALLNIAGLLKPNGIICITDIDDSLFFLFPEPADLNSFIDRSVKYQSLSGGDRHIGRKLPLYLNNAGFDNIKTRIKVMSSFDIGLTGFLQTVLDFRAEQLPENELKTAQTELSNIYMKMKQSFAWGAFGLFVATG